MNFLYYYQNRRLTDCYTAIADNGDAFSFSATQEPELLFNIIDAAMTERLGIGWSMRITLSKKQEKEIIDNAIAEADIISELGERIKFHSLPEPAKNHVRALKGVEC